MNDYVLYHLPTTPTDILSFWFSDKSCPKWFAKDPSFDAVVSARYGTVLQAAKRGELFQWRETIRGRLDGPIFAEYSQGHCNSVRE
jgi:uncharacterized protein (DUF924 family)